MVMFPGMDRIPARDVGTASVCAFCPKNGEYPAGRGESICRDCLRLWYSHMTDNEFDGFLSKQRQIVEAVREQRKPAEKKEKRAKTNRH